MKAPSLAPAYVGLFPILAEAAQAHGYALAVHGSVSRDFDLIAVPWTETASDASTLHLAIAARVGIAQGRLHEMVDARGPLDVPEKKPHGRLAWAIPLDCGAVIDLSVMPRHEQGGVE